MEKPFIDLAHAIVLKAAEDYRHALRALKKNPKNHNAEMEVASSLQFFKSDWCYILAGMDGMIIVNLINKEEKI